MSSTTDLPTELWTKIALDSDPLDVVFLSQTCSSLHATLTDRAVWKAILGNVMRKYGDFIVSYSIDDMTVEALQKAASGPYRWRALLDQSATLDQETAQILPIQTDDKPKMARCPG
ncbi:hypothetical protein FA13DRAFT_1794975 [Coprinellus micaceus]|uniref:F-box domain-containing protein n=1 Tax=Coprinellus micaceus TaxID=71717 RepID=A0A4Y7SZ62_COPMI|nr:hypothetical protein FA13DRAFT_1794975 [Coprinellus micaceus]